MASYIISGANGDIGISVADILREKFSTATIIGTDIESKWPALGASFDDVEIIPRANQEGYVDALERLVKKYSAEYVIPTSEPELRWIAKNHDKCAHIPFLMNDTALILSCMDKLESIFWLKSIGVKVPKTSLLSEASVADVPFLMKPRYGAGSRGIKIIKSEEAFNALSANDGLDDYVAQEYLDQDDQEYTCAIVKLQSDFRVFIMRRKLKEGVTFEMYGLENAAISEMLTSIAGKLPPYSAINVQLRLTEDGPRIFEINPRFSSTIKMRHMLGFSDFLWMLEGLKGKGFPEAKPVLGQKVYRVYKEIMGVRDASLL